ncbi:c-type cytochrome [Novipirellula sp.]|uniref:c-type cytochrome n=1 Tax=Novipirellula sp. TaxID=2795430 RepID=UPI00356AFD09
MKMKPIHVALCLLVLISVGCTPDPKSGKGFTLPEGDIQRGQQTFATLHCQACHTVKGVTFDTLESSADQKMVALGGAKTKVQTYGDLVTSIINPSHRFATGYAEEEVATDGESKMRRYNNEMTVQQLIDLVAFLESHYSVIQYDQTRYVPFHF